MIAELVWSTGSESYEILQSSLYKREGTTYRSVSSMRILRNVTLFTQRENHLSTRIMLVHVSIYLAKVNRLVHGEVGIAAVVRIQFIRLIS